MKDRYWALLAFGAAVLLGGLARGLAGDEEAFHYLVAKFAPTHPDLFLSLAGRPLLTLGLTLPSQFGIMGARMATALISGGVAWGVARAARHSGLSPGWAVVFLMVQPFFLAHVGTAMTEPWAAFCLIWAMVGLFERRWVLFAVMMGLLPLARLEWGLLFLPAGLLLIARKEWVPLLLVGVPVLALHFAGAISSGDPLWLLHQAQWKLYPERNADHYLQSFSWTLGAGITPLVVLGMAGAVMEKGRAKTAAQVSLWLVGFALLVYTYLATFRPTTYGNLRYMAIVAPAFALLGAVGVDWFKRAPRQTWIWVTLGAVTALSFSYWGYELYRDTSIMATEIFWPIGAAAAAVTALYFLRGKLRWTVSVLAVVVQIALISQVYTTTLHWKIRSDAMVAHDIMVLIEEPLKPGTINASPMLQYFSGLDPYNGKDIVGASPEALDNAEPGTLFFWESHYCPKKDNALMLEQVLKRDDWEFVTGVVSADSSVAGALLMKDGGTLPKVRDGGWFLDDWAEFALMGQYGWIHSRNAVQNDPESYTRWQSYVSRSLMCRKYQEAEDALPELRRTGGNTVDYYKLAADTYRRHEKREEFYQTLAEAHEEHPEEEGLLYASAVAAMDAGHKEDAAERMKRAAESDHDNVIYQFNTGRLLADLERWDESSIYLRRAVLLDSKKYEHVAYMATVLGKIGQAGEGEKLLRRAIEAMPAMADPYIRLGDLLMDEGRAREARRVWRNGLEKSPENSELRDRLGES